MCAWMPSPRGRGPRSVIPTSPVYLYILLHYFVAFHSFNPRTVFIFPVELLQRCEELLRGWALGACDERIRGSMRVDLARVFAIAFCVLRVLGAWLSIDGCVFLVRVSRADGASKSWVVNFGNFEYSQKCMTGEKFVLGKGS